MIDPSLTPAQQGEETFAVKTPIPGGVTHRVILFGPLSFQHRFGFPVIDLLFPILSYLATTMMPDQGGWVEPQRHPALLQTPAQIDVVSRNSELPVKSSNIR
jgi:hypothetical protein